MFNDLMKSDALMWYAQLGLLLIFFRKFSFKTLIIIAGVVIFLTCLIDGYQVHVEKLEFYKTENVIPSHEQQVQHEQTEVEELLRAHQFATGSFKDITKFRMKNLVDDNTIIKDWRYGLSCISVFLIGLAIVKTYLKQWRYATLLILSI